MSDPLTSSTNPLVIMLLLNDYNGDLRVQKQAHTLRNQQFQVRILATHSDKRLKGFENHRNGTTITRYSVSSIPFVKYFIFWMIAFFKILSQNPAVIVAHDLHTLPAGVLIKIFKKKVRLVYDTHEFFPGMVGEELGGVFYWIFVWLEKWLINKADYITTDSFTRMLYLKDLYTITKPITFLFNAPFAKIRHYRKKNISKKENQFIVINSGRVVAKTRGFELLPDIANHIKENMKEDDPEIKIIVLGDGPFRAQAEQLVENRKVGDVVEFWGHFPYAEAMAISKNGDLGLIYFQPFSDNPQYAGPIRLFDYMGNGLPILATDLVELRRVIQKEDIGWILPPGDPNKIGAFILDLARKPRKLAAKKRRVEQVFPEKYTWEVMEVKIRRIYHFLLKQW